MKNFVAHTEDIRKEMLESINCNSVDDLFKQIPVFFKGFDMQNPLSEMETQKQIKALARKNKVEDSTFLGGGVYKK